MLEWFTDPSNADLRKIGFYKDTPDFNFLKHLKLDYYLTQNEFNLKKFLDRHFEGDFTFD